jgi:hypothetical protein
MLYPYFFGGVLSIRQHTILDALACQRGVSKSAVVRQLIEAQAPHVGLASAADGEGMEDTADDEAA